MNRTPEHNARIGEALKARGIGASATKVCPRCEQDLPRSDYATRSNGHSKSLCRACERSYNAEKSRRHYASHPEAREARRQSNRKAQFKRKYGITVDEFDTMLEAQGGGCAICGGQPDRGRQDLDVDHDHVTGKVRGLLCSSCNMSLGKMGDDATRLRAAADYLDTHRDRLD